MLEAPADPAAWEKLGDAYRRSFRRSQAVDAYRTALQLDPSRTELQRHTSGTMTREARDLRRLARRTPGDDEVWGDLGDLLAAYGDAVGAQSAYLRAFRIDPADSEWHTALARLGQGELVLAMVSPNVNEGDDESLGDYADLLASLDRTVEACEYWRRAAELDPFDTEWIEHASSCGFEVPEGYGLADTGIAVGEYTGEYSGEYGGMVELVGPAEPEDLQTLVQRVRSDSGLLVKLGQAYLRTGDLPKAEETLWGALLVEHTDEEALQSYLIAARKTRREVLEKLWASFGDDDELAGALADHYLDLGLRDQARSMYATAHRLDPEDPEWTAKSALLDPR